MIHLLPDVETFEYLALGERSGGYGVPTTLYHCYQFLTIIIVITWELNSNR
jgi:hypothetical protein